MRVRVVGVCVWCVCERVSEESGLCVSECV